MSRVKPDELLISHPRKAAAGVRRDRPRRANALFLEPLRSSQIKGYFNGQNILIISHCVILTFQVESGNRFFLITNICPILKK